MAALGNVTVPYRITLKMSTLTHALSVLLNKEMIYARAAAGGIVNTSVAAQFSIRLHTSLQCHSSRYRR
jgi:hypothetical protein